MIKGQNRRNNSELTPKVENKTRKFPPKTGVVKDFICFRIKLNKHIILCLILLYNPIFKKSQRSIEVTKEDVFKHAVDGHE